MPKKPETGGSYTLDQLDAMAAVEAAREAAQRAAEDETARRAALSPEQRAAEDAEAPNAPPPADNP